MSLQDLLTDLKLGKDKIEHMTVHYNDNTYDIEYRHLTLAEVQKISSMNSKNITIGGKVKNRSTDLHIKDIKANKVTNSRYEAQLLAVSLSLSIGDVKISTKEIEDLFENEVFEEIYEKIKEANGLDDDEISEESEEEIKNFREN